MLPKREFGHTRRKYFSCDELCCYLLDSGCIRSPSQRALPPLGKLGRTDRGVAAFLQLRYLESISA